MGAVGAMGAGIMLRLLAAAMPPLRFLSSGTLSRMTQLEYVSDSVPCWYLEGFDLFSKGPAWIGAAAGGALGCDQVYLRDSAAPPLPPAPPPPAECLARSEARHGVNTPGCDMGSRGVDDAGACCSLCGATPTCMAWVFCDRAQNCTMAPGTCWLKSCVPFPVNQHHNLTAGRAVKPPPSDPWQQPWAQPKRRTPPAGVRSAPALGALGGGTVELRADGRFAEWLIFNK